MKVATWGALMGAAVFAACFVDRPSQAFECKTTADCADLPGRMCSGGFCVVPNCPSGCDTCDEGLKTCTIDCTSGAASCGSVQCLPGWTCTIRCTGDTACGSIACLGGSKCDIVCTGTDACGSISCRDACACDVDCVSGTSCQGTSCPNNSQGNRCTTDGTNATPCDSSPQGCVRC